MVSLPPGFVVSPQAEAEHDILFSEEFYTAQREFLDGGSVTLDLEVRSPNREVFWVRVTPIEHRPNDVHATMWHIEDATCVRLDEARRPVGPEGTCNGWFSTVRNDGAVAGKLTISFD